MTLRTSVRDGLAYTVRRGLRQQPSLTTSDNKTIASIDLERGTFLPLDAYTGLEIEAIADESLGERRRLLLDELRQDDLRRVQARIAEHRLKLEANADEISSLTRDLANTNEEIEEIGDIKARLEALPPPPPDGRSAELMKASRQAQMNSRELVGSPSSGTDSAAPIILPSQFGIKACFVRYRTVLKYSLGFAPSPCILSTFTQF